MADFEVDYVTLSGGRSLPAYKMVCPECRTLVLGTTVNTDSTPWRAHCPNGHDWRVEERPNA